MEGNSSFEELSRIDVLRMTTEVATPVNLYDGSVRNQQPGPVQQLKQTKLVGPPAYGTICDVQRVHARDIRKLDSTFSVSNEPSIELRNQAILINAGALELMLSRSLDGI